MEPSKKIEDKPFFIQESKPKGVFESLKKLFSSSHSKNSSTKPTNSLPKTIVEIKEPPPRKSMEMNRSVDEKLKRRSMSFFRLELNRDSTGSSNLLGTERSSHADSSSISRTESEFNPHTPPCSTPASGSRFSVRKFSLPREDLSIQEKEIVWNKCQTDLRRIYKALNENILDSTKRCCETEKLILSSNNGGQLCWVETSTSTISMRFDAYHTILYAIYQALLLNKKEFKTLPAEGFKEGKTVLIRDLFNDLFKHTESEKFCNEEIELKTLIPCIKMRLYLLDDRNFVEMLAKENILAQTSDSRRILLDALSQFQRKKVEEIKKNHEKLKTVKSVASLETFQIEVILQELEIYIQYNRLKSDAKKTLFLNNILFHNPEEVQGVGQDDHPIIFSKFFADFRIDCLMQKRFFSDLFRALENQTFPKFIEDLAKEKKGEQQELNYPIFNKTVCKNALESYRNRHYISCIKILLAHFYENRKKTPNSFNTLFIQFLLKAYILIRDEKKCEGLPKNWLTEASERMNNPHDNGEVFIKLLSDISAIIQPPSSCRESI